MNKILCNILLSLCKVRAWKWNNSEIFKSENKGNSFSLEMDEFFTPTYQVPTRIWNRLFLLFCWFTLPKGHAWGGFEWGTRAIIYWIRLFLSKEGGDKLFHFLLFQSCLVTCTCIYWNTYNFASLKMPTWFSTVAHF